MKQLFKKEELIGKTIKKILYPCGGELWMSFTDDSFICFRSHAESSGFGYQSEFISIEDFTFDNACHELVELELITRTDYEIAIEEEDKKYEKIRQEKEIEEKKRNEDEELKLLSELKKKYEK